MGQVFIPGKREDEDELELSFSAIFEIERGDFPGELRDLDKDL